MKNRSYRVKQCENCKAKNALAVPPIKDGTYAYSTLTCSKCGEFPGTISSYRDCPHDPVHRWDEKGICVKQQAKSRKRERHVFDTGEIPHLWAHQVQHDARNKQGNLYFEGPTIYSYGPHFPMASFVENKRGRKAVLYTTRRYSVTTSGHLSAVRSAIPKNIPVFSVPIVRTGWYGSHQYADTTPEMHQNNLKAYTNQLTGEIEKATRARTLWSKRWQTKQAYGTRDEAIRYAKFFGLPVPKLPAVPKLTAAMIRKMTEREKFLASNEHKAVVLVERARREMNEDFARRRAAANTIEEWRKGNIHARIPYGVPVMLRVRGNEVETSLGVRVPVSHAQHVLKAVRMVVARHEAFISNGHTLPVGVYKVEQIDADGTLRAGCHVISYGEIERIAPQVEGWKAAEVAS